MRTTKKQQNSKMREGEKQSKSKIKPNIFITHKLLTKNSHITRTLCS